jgi:uncharacterized membrane protein YiaA
MLRFFDMHQKQSIFSSIPSKNKFKPNTMYQKPSNAFIGASWVALFAGGISYCTGLWNASMLLNEKGYYFAVLMYGLFSAISLQKAVRDQVEGVRVTAIYYGISWFSTILSILLLVIGLWNAEMTRSEKGFYGMSFTLALFAAVAVQKNIRDSQSDRKKSKEDEDSNS